MNENRPVFQGQSFQCPSCRIVAQQRWCEVNIYPRNSGGRQYRPLEVCECVHCNYPSIWLHEQMIYPQESIAAEPHEDMPEKLVADFNEARSIVNKSPRGAAALLRLALQKLMVELGQPGKDLNKDIGALVQKGLPTMIQQALDTVRVTGNESVHPGELNLNDTPEVAYALFGLINLIVDNQIAQPKRIANLYGSLPVNKILGINTRDGNVV